MSATQKFMFDRSFDPPEVAAVEKPAEEDVEEVVEPEEIIPTFSEAELEATRQEAFEKGKEEGIREASEATESHIRDTTRAIGIQLSEQYRHQQAANADILDDAINAAVAIVRKCFPHMESEHQIIEIEHMVKEILAQIIEEPRVVITVHPEISTPLGERMEMIKSDTHFDGRVVIREDASISPGDCRVEWSNGGADRNSKELWRQIDEIVENNLGAASKLAKLDSASDNGPVPQKAENQPENASDTEPDGVASESTNKNDGAEAVETAKIEAEELTTPPLKEEAEREQDVLLETPEGAPPTPFVDDEETTDNPQVSTDLGEVDGATVAAPGSSVLNEQMEEVDAADHAPHPPTLDDNKAGMEPEAEAGILDTEQDADPTLSTEQPA